MNALAYQNVSAQQARDDLILRHLPLVRHTIGRLLAQLPAGIDEENLCAAGTLGLVEAAHKFDPERGVKFEVFAAWRIRGAVLDELRRNCPAPQHLLERIGAIRRAYANLPAPASLEAIAAETGLTHDEVSECLAAMRMMRTVSWESLSEARQGELSAQQPDDAAEVQEQKRLLAQAITRLPQRERLVVTLYYLEDLRLKEIGQVLQLSESRVSRILSDALFALGETMRQYEA